MWAQNSEGLNDYWVTMTTVWLYTGGSYSDVVAEVSNRDTLVGEEVESSELMNEQNKRKRVYPTASVCPHLFKGILYLYV